MLSPVRRTVLACSLAALAAAPACSKSKRQPASTAAPTARPTTASALPSPTPALSPEERFQSAATEVAAQLSARHPSLRVLFISGHVESAVASSNPLPGRSGVLEKPFRPAVLAERVRDLLDI